MENENYTSRTAEDKEVLRQLEISTLAKMIQNTPAEKRDEYKLVVGDRTFTLQEMLEEAKRGTEYGELFLAVQSKSRLEQLKRK
jgi:hypothetical protein